MANKVLRTRIAQKFATALEWQESQLVLLKGELALDEQNRIKIGDGVHFWKDLPFVVDGKSTAISFPAALPEASSTDYKSGNLVLTEDGKLWCLVGDDQTPAEREWKDLTNKSDIESLQSGIAVLQNEAESLQSAVVALQAALDSNGGEFADEIEALREDVTVNVANIAANRADIDTIWDSQTGKINSSVLPSFVDDVVEGLVCISESESDATFKLTHNDGAVIGFFGASGADEEGSTRALKLVTAQSPAEENLSAVSYEENGVTYSFPAEPVKDKVAPSSSIIYVDVRTNKTYRWSGSQFVVVASDLALGETAATAYAGDKGAEVYNEVLTTTENHVSLKDRVDALETKAESHDAAIVALQTECETKHQALEDEFAAGIVSLKQESEQKDAAHDAAIVALQEQVNSINAGVSAMTMQEVIDNSSSVLNSDFIVLDCGGAE